jgi:tripartite ATP-independent transporter DctM subunit
MTAYLSTILTLAVFGMPLFCVLGAIGLAGLQHADTPLASAIADVYRLAGAEAVSLSTIPLFTFAGYLMARAKTAERLVRMAEALLGWIPGGLALMTLWTCAFFTIFTGASGVTIVALGGLLLPELEKSRYSKRFSIEVVTGSPAVGLLFPPALPLIVYAIVFALTAGHASEGGKVISFSIERFLFAGLVPGLFLLVLLSIYCVVQGWRSKVPTFPLDLKKFGKAFWEAKWEIPIPFVIILMMVRGWATIPETAALTALYVFVIEVWVYKDISIKKDLFSLTRESMTLVGAIFMKIAAATILTTFFVDAGVPERLFHWLNKYVTSPIGFLLCLNVLLLLVGCLMDIFSAIVVVVPLIVPAAAQFGIDPYHLGVIFLLNLEIGYLLPPAGLNLFIAAFRFNRPITELYRAVIPFILIMLVALLTVTFFPKLVVVPAEKKPASAAPAGDEGGERPSMPPAPSLDDEPAAAPIPPAPSLDDEPAPTADGG